MSDTPMFGGKSFGGSSPDRGLFVWLSVVSLAVIVGFLLGAFVIRNDLSNLRSQQLHSCERDNVQRAQDNNSHLQDYHVFSFVAARFLEPTKTETAAQKRITDEFAGTLRAAVAEKSWVPLTDCAVAVSAEGSNYQPPQPIPFFRGTAPASALDASTAGQPSPPGSTP